jgi:hypothetical protein
VIAPVGVRVKNASGSLPFFHISAVPSFLSGYR